MKSWRSKSWIWAGALAASLALTGCGSNSDTADESQDNGETTADGQTEAAAGGESAYPEQDITFIVPYSAGGGTDVLAREMGPMLEEELGVSVIVENQPGGQTIPALNRVSQADDGYTIVFEGALIAGLSARDIEDTGPDEYTPIAIPQADPMALTVPADSPYETLEDFVAAAEAEPDSLQVSTSAAGGVNHAAMTLLRDQGLPIDIIPFSEGTAPAVTAMLGGEVDAVSAPPAAALDHVEAGDARILGVGSEEPLESLPDVATFADAGFEGPYVKAFRVVLASPNVDDAVTTTLEEAFLAVYERDDFQEFLASNSFQPLEHGHEDSISFLDEQVDLYQSIYGDQ